MSLAVIIPTLNEERRIGHRLAELACEAGVAEIIVADGGSDDATLEIAARAGARVIEAPRGRARQQNVGASRARSDVLLFLHADVRLPRGFAFAASETLARRGVVAGAFRTRHVAEGRWRARRRAMLLRLADLRSRYSPLPYGDQAIFVCASTFARLGGFPDIPLMEDLELSRRLSEIGEVVIASDRVTVSGRRFESQPVTQCLMVNLFPLLYAAGVPPRFLAAIYGNPR